MNSFDIINLDIDSLSKDVFFCVGYNYEPDNIQDFYDYVKIITMKNRPIIYINYLFQDYKPAKYRITLDCNLSFKSNKAFTKEGSNNIGVKLYSEFLKMREANTTFTMNVHSHYIECSGYHLPDSITLANLLASIPDSSFEEVDTVHMCLNCVYNTLFPNTIDYTCLANVVRIPTPNTYNKLINEPRDCSSWEYQNNSRQRLMQRLTQSRVVTEEFDVQQHIEDHLD